MVADFLTSYRMGESTSRPLVELTGQPDTTWRELLDDGLRLDNLAETRTGAEEDIFAP